MTSKMAPSSSNSSGMSSGGGVGPERLVPLEHDTLTFDGRQEVNIKDMEKRLQDEMKKKKRDWERDVQRMREEFLVLYPVDKSTDECHKDPFVAKRRGSADVLDHRKMKTMFLEYPDIGRKFKVRFDCRDMDPKTVKVNTEGNRIVVRATKSETDENGDDNVDREYMRKIEKPKEVDANKTKSFLTTDGILIVEALLPPHSLNLRKITQSPSHSSQGSRASSRSRSPSNSPRTPIANQKPGVPIFIDAENGMRRMSMLVDIGPYFKPKDVTVQIIKDNIIQVKCKHEEKTPERLCKNKFMKEYELPEKIEAFTIRGGLTAEGKLLIGAVSKGHTNGMSIDQAGEWVSEELGINSKKFSHCNVLDLASFPPTNVMSRSMTSSISS